jgi:predicted nucleotidyltransferase
VRLSAEEVTILKEKLYSLSSTARLYLFGSRADDSKRGGDIDLLVISEALTKRDLRLLRVDFFKHFGEQKLDIILDDGKLTNTFTKHIFKKAILL